LAEKFVEQAEAHGVLGAFLQHFFSCAADDGFCHAKQMAQHRQRANAMFSLMLSHEADALMSDLRGIAIVVKGPTFARTIYPRPSLRCFSDIDLLVPPQMVPKVANVLLDRGYCLAETNPAHDPSEWKWVHHLNPRLMVEVQTDLVHADSLRKLITLPYELIAPSPDTSAALLHVALIHGGIHHYERLQHVVDICQAARALTGSVEEEQFFRLVQASNAQFISSVGLALAARIFAEPRCREIAQAIGPVRYTGISRILLSRALVMSATESHRNLHNWRRKAFRWFLKRGEVGNN
jgi:hypothetical protein